MALLATGAPDGRLTSDRDDLQGPARRGAADGGRCAGDDLYWSDYACGYCYRVQPTLDTLTRMFPGQLRWCIAAAR
ncbi:MAG: hypothetical protein IPQ07_17570 [Myxococcales bacterium]|nr:hypothetical protein [Myxococcales bacterium]